MLTALKGQVIASICMRYSQSASWHCFRNNAILHSMAHGNYGLEINDMGLATPYGLIIIVQSYMSRLWAKASSLRLHVSLSCAVLCQIVSLQYLSRSSLRRFAGLPVVCYCRVVVMW